MPRVTGLGGDFFKSENPEKLYHWYEKHLGITREPHGQSASFRWHEPDGAEGLTAWALFPKDTTYFDPSPAPPSCSTTAWTTLTVCCRRWPTQARFWLAWEQAPSRLFERIFRPERLEYGSRTGTPEISRPAPAAHRRSGERLCVRPRRGTPLRPRQCLPIPPAVSG